MKKVSLWLFVLFVVVKGYGQQEAQYTQFMYNKLSLNPAYAGSLEAPCISCIHRSQWIGLDGAPSSQVLNFHLPTLGEKVGVGASLSRDKIGPTSSVTFSGMYAYRLKMDKGNFSFGLRGTLRSHRVDWNTLIPTQSGDSAIPTESGSTILPNFGFGAYFTSEKFYAGVSIPNMVSNDLKYTSEVDQNSDIGKERRHIYFMSGYLFEIANKVKLKPALLLKYVSNAPYDLDLNTTVIFMDKLWAGISYRLGGDSTGGSGESVSLLVQYQLTPEFRAGLAYDYTLSKLRSFDSGTAEIEVQYCFGRKNDSKKSTNPRFF